MSVNGEETSRKSGSPFELYDITVNGTVYRFTSGEEPWTQDGNDYTPTALLRSNLDFQRDYKDGYYIQIANTHPLAQQYIFVPPPMPATVLIRRFHRFDELNQAITMFQGVIIGVKFGDNGIAQVGIAPGNVTFTRPVPRYVYSGLCGHILGDRWCNADGTVDLATGVGENGLPFKHTGTVDSYDPATGILTVGGIESAGYEENYFAGGSIQMSYNNDIRLITQSGIAGGGNGLKIYIPFFDDPTGHSAVVTVGCAHDLLTCQSKFGNAVNIGAFPFVPLKNPFVVGLGDATASGDVSE
jgi:Phage conserved hypothetical protein BR0599